MGIDKSCIKNRNESINLNCKKTQKNRKKVGEMVLAQIPLGSGQQATSARPVITDASKAF